MIACTLFLPFFTAGKDEKYFNCIRTQNYTVFICKLENLVEILDDSLKPSPLFEVTFFKLIFIEICN